MPPAVLHSKLMDSELAKASIFFVEIEASFIFMDCVIVKPKIHMQRMNIVIIFCFICSQKEDRIKCKSMDNFGGYYVDYFNDSYYCDKFLPKAIPSFFW